MRVFGLLVVAGLLGGCNVVHTSMPMFSAADAAGAPMIRSGVWASPEKGCDFDPNMPVKAWPSCANGGSTSDLKPGESFQLVAGDPPLIQYKSVNDDHGAAYFYGAYQPVGFDAQHRVIAMQVWTIDCGPPPPAVKSKPGKPRGPYGTKHPLPGLVMDPDGTNCTTTDVSAIRAAVGPSRQWSGPQTSYWVRDGDH